MRAERDRSAAPAPSRSGRDQPADLDVHGVVRLRLAGEARRDLEGLQRQVGPLPHVPRGGVPEVRVRFVSRLTTPELRWIEPGRVGFTDTDLVVGEGGRPTARVPLDRLGRGGEIVCERGVGRVPFLYEAMEVAAVRKGLLPLHAAAFVHEGAGALVLGWPHGGKTSALLAFLERGAQFVADDLVLLDPRDHRLLGIASPLELWDWQAAQLPGARSVLPRRRRAAWRALRSLEAVVEATPSRARRWLPGLSGLDSLVSGARRRLRGRVPIDRLYPGSRGGATRVAHVFFMLVHDSPEVRVERVTADRLLPGIARSASAEMLPLRRSYLEWGFAFPDRRNAVLEEALVAVTAPRLREALGAVEYWLVRHPRPVDLGRLFEAMKTAWAAPGAHAAAPTPRGPESHAAVTAQAQGPDVTDAGVRS